MNLYEAATTDARSASTTSTEDLISEWSVRMFEFRSRSHRRLGRDRAEADLVRAYRVRDQLNIRLRCTTRSVSECSDAMSRVLHTADDLLLELTEEADTATTLTAHDHYGKASEWWWKRLLVDSSQRAGGIR